MRNTFDDTVDETVSKRWAAPNADGTLVDLDEVPDHTLTSSIYDGDVKIAEAVMDGAVDAAPIHVTLMGGVDEDIKADFEQANPTYQETKPDHLEIENLPRYKSDGSRYNYRFVEGTKLSDWRAQSSYDAENHLTTIVNTPATGEGTNVILEKDWVDAGDASHRLAARIELYAKEDIRRGDGELVYENGATLPILIRGEDDNLKQVSSVTITEDDTWFKTATIMGVTDADLGKVGVRETYLVATGMGDDSKAAKYEVITFQEAKEDPVLKDQSWVNTGWADSGGFNNNSYERVSTGEHVYEVSYKSATAEESPYELPTFYVSNRRIGLVNVSIEKTWKDGATKAAGRPDAIYRIACDDPEAVFDVNAEGQVTVKLNNGNTLPLFWEDPDLSGEAPKRLTGSVEKDENGRTTLLVKVPKGTDDESTVTTSICGLPKYDGNGTVVSYSVTEEWADGSDYAGYASSLSEPTYTTGMWHFKDTCTYIATNSLVGSRDVTFFKEWNDAYIREGAGQRPDINLTLYRVSAAEGSTPQKVTAPAGYQRLGEFTFTVTEGGVFEAQATSTGSAAAGDLTAGYRLSADGLVLVAVDAPQQGGGDPGEPEDPDPEDPDDPDGPDDPEDPGDPDEPDEPDEPGEPSEPGKPGEPSEEVPDAGDHTNVGLPVALMLSGVVLVTSAALVLRCRGQNR